MKNLIPAPRKCKCDLCPKPIVKGELVFRRNEVLPSLMANIPRKRVYFIHRDCFVKFQDKLEYELKKAKKG